MKTPLAAFLAVALPAAAAWAQPDSKKTAAALQQEGSRFEGEKEYQKAIDKYRKSIEKAAADKNTSVLAKSLVGLGRCNENLVPENVSEALSAYGRVVSECADQRELAAWAEEKVRRKGVDVFVRVFAASVREWRDNKTRGSGVAIEEKKKELWGKVQPLDKDAAHGLISQLNHDDEIVRIACAEQLAEVIDDGGYTELIGKLGEKGYTAGAALALNKVFVKWMQARGYDDQAERIREDLSKLNLNVVGVDVKVKFKDLIEHAALIATKNPGDTVTIDGKTIKLTAEDIAAAKKLIEHLPEGDRLGTIHGSAESNHRKNLERADELAKKAGEIRHNIPQALNSAGAQEAFARLIADEAGEPVARLEACKCLESIGDIGGDLVDAVVGALSSKDRNVRRGAAVAAGAVDTTRSQDKHRLVDRLMAIVQFVAENDLEHKDPANEPMVREAAAESLGKIGVIKAIPALIVALNDNAAAVRNRANVALIAITGKDLGYESDPHVQDPNIKDPAQRMDEKTKREKQLAIRKEGIQKWEQWWNETGGVIVLVERFYRVAAGWKSFDPAKLFDKDAFLAEVKSRRYVFSDPDEAIARAERTVDRFQRIKEFHEQDGVDVGKPAIDKLLKYLSGVVESDPRRTAAPATRAFVAETLAKIAGKENDSQVIDTLVGLVAGGATQLDRAGAALALGYLQKGQVTSAVRDALAMRGLTAGEWEVKDAAARALSRVGEETNGNALADVASDVASHGRPEGIAVAVSALRAIAVLKPRSPDVVRKLADLIGHEPEPGQMPKKSPDDLVRETACVALGEIGDPLAVKEMGLLRARRDSGANVRGAARKAIDQIVSKDAGAVKDIVAALKDIKLKADDRRGAALALGVSGAGGVQALIWSLIDENPPLKLRDPDSAVRAAVCRGLGEVGEKARYQQVGEALLAAMDDVGEEIRAEAYNALREIAPKDAQGASLLNDFNPIDTLDMRRAAMEKIKNQLGGWNWPKLATQ